MTRKYSTASALRAALDDRILERARALGRDPNWLRRRLAFTRLLVRLVNENADTWVLKGGMAVELRRPGLARATRDVDLVMRPGLVADPADGMELHEALTEALLTDPDGDGFVYSATSPARLRDDAYGRPAWRFPIECRLAGQLFAKLKLDVVARPEELGGVELRELPDELAFAQIPTRAIWVADLRQQYAEKLHALTRLYETGESTRVRDLVDLVLLVEDGVPADAELVRRVHHVFTIRRTHAVPDDLPDPPPSWAARYEVLAAEIGLAVTSSTEAHKIVSGHWQQARAAQEG
ncbi:MULTISPECIES: nucleotidyl transferase AbiEii/AbiGii toxin family protein [Micromonospora]|uniref:Nucleotidyl transferase AbiEii/AbiGii toxin family protein n=1 Tax=Micromonospora solifontis TaxID=2487138 RepID=A0ABX9W8D4_9ACTN|nr:MULTISPECIES: nucleotidyl transferase AbiEii/AbiGii toxin family protein [Micromonospora]NES13371.1 nucleotidyl transferase AbiEii/AbiGii toxin family protein [Micromonospora sp. PPF5-17B]NES39708.1 nucleotidyl transferase AbiEii/AbiGii toxin family protein [Micromonospora solifontis]NES59151.1 nucleotidyl transferase AbiEii/AbiGii toxin family protein [Micromonospora sp. PPF5-6]RNL86726.1 nucleotidyl transferase AbiEii/AbiGii toxin family protein [Micromonospora solifontis]